MLNKLIIVFFLVSNILFAQNSVTTNTVGNGDLSDGLWVISKDAPKKIEGTPYLFNDWSHKGKVYFNDRVYTLNSFNYNIQAERFEVKISQDSVFALNHGSFNKVEIEGKFYVRYLDPDFQRNTYFESIINFKNKILLKKYVLKIKEGQINPMTMQKIQEDKYIKSEKFYIVEKDTEKIIKIKLNKSGVMSIIDDTNKTKIKVYAKAKHLSFKRIEDISEILNYYNTL